jgi:sugar phosphate permease
MIHYAWIIVLTGTLVVLSSHGFGRMSYSLILPAMRDGLALNYTQVGLIGTGNFIGYLFLALVGGFLAARFGVRRLVFFSLLVMGVSLFATGLSDSFLSAFFMRMVTGMGNGGAYVPMMALPAAWFAAGKRGFATGIMPMGTGIGLTITGLMLPPLMAGHGQEGWRYAWFALGCMVFLCSFACYALLRDTPAEKGLSMYGGLEPERIRKNVTILSAWKDVWSEREIWKLGGVYFMYGFSYIIYLTFFVVYLTKEIGISPRSAGAIFALLGFIAIFCGIVWGAISDAVGRRYGSMLAYLTLAAAYLLAALWHTMPGLYFSAVLFGLAMSSLPVIMAAAVGDAVGGRLAPAGLGFITVFFGVGQALGPACAGWIKDTTGSFTNAFVLSAIVSVIGALGSLMMRKRS